MWCLFVSNQTQIDYCHDDGLIFWVNKVGWINSFVTLHGEMVGNMISQYVWQINMMLYNLILIGCEACLPYVDVAIQNLSTTWIDALRIGKSWDNKSKIFSRVWKTFEISCVYYQNVLYIINRNGKPLWEQAIDLPCYIIVWIFHMKRLTDIFQAISVMYVLILVKLYHCI